MCGRFGGRGRGGRGDAGGRSAAGRGGRGRGGRGPAADFIGEKQNAKEVSPQGMPPVEKSRCV